MSTQKEDIAIALRSLPVDSRATTSKHSSYLQQSKLAWEDVVESIKQWRIWLMLGYQDIQLRYRRSVLGPFWLTLSMAITLYSMGYLYSHLFRMKLNFYFPYLIAGMLSWSLISTMVMELVDTFPTAEHMLKQMKLPYFLYVHRIITRNFLIFFHNILVIIPVLIIYHQATPVNGYFFFIIPGLSILYFNALTYGIVLAMIGARYRDISQIIKSLIGVIFFLTPIMWEPSILPEGKRFIALWNPFYAFVELIRAPMIGRLPTSSNLLMVAAVTVIGIGISYYMFTARRARIIFWL